MNEKQMVFAKAIAALDAIIISAREQQVALGKILAADLGVSELQILSAIKESSTELLFKNGLDY